MIVAGEKHFAQPYVTGAALRLSHHEDITDQCPFDEQSCGANQNQLTNFFRVARGNFCRNPTAYATADQVELRNVQRIEKLQIVKDDIFNGLDILVLVALGTARMCRRNEPRVCSEAFVERHPGFLDRMNVGEAVQIKQRSAAAVFQEPNFALIEVQDAAAHGCASVCSLMS